MAQASANSIETALVLALLARSPSEIVIDLLGADLDWVRFIKIVDDHRVAPTIFQAISPVFKDHVPSVVYDELQQMQTEISIWNFGRTTQLIRLIDLLKKHDIPVVSYKGMALASLAYKDITLRQFTDIDLLINRRDFFKVKSLFLQNGCTPAWTISETQEAAVLKYYYEYPFFCGDSKTLIEVHWYFVEPFFAFDLTIKEVIARAHPVSLLGKPVPTLSPEDHLIVLSAHGSKHLWKRLSWVLDLARLVENTYIDWALVMERAKDSGSMRMVLLGLGLAKTLLNTTLPADFDRCLTADESANELVNLICGDLFDEDETSFGWREMAAIHLRMRERTRDKARYIRRLFTTKLIDSIFLPMGRPQ